VEEVRLREAASEQQSEPDWLWFRRQIQEALRAWEVSDAGQKANLLSRVWERVEAEKLSDGSLWVVVIPSRSGSPSASECWISAGYKRETSLELAEDASWGGKRVLPPAA